MLLTLLFYLHSCLVCLCVLFSWYLHPPSVELYSKQPPLRTLTQPTNPPLPPPCTVTQKQGELIFVPTQWSHATINMQETIGIAVEVDVGHQLMTEMC